MSCCFASHFVASHIDHVRDYDPLKASVFFVDRLAFMGLELNCGIRNMSLAKIDLIGLTMSVYNEAPDQSATTGHRSQCSKI